MAEKLKIRPRHAARSSRALVFCILFSHPAVGPHRNYFGCQQYYYCPCRIRRYVATSNKRKENQGQCEDRDLPIPALAPSVHAC